MTVVPSEALAPSVAAPALRLSRFWLLQIGGWLAYVVVMASSRIGMFPFRYMLVSKATLGLMGFVCSLVLWRLYRRVIATNPGIGRIVVVAVIGSYLAALAWTAGDTVTNIPIARWALDRHITVRSVGQLFNGAVYNSFTLLAWSVLYFGIRHHDAWQTERERSLRAEALAQQARLEALRYQLQPHFLFNTLNAISTLVVERRIEDAGRMIARLSDFLRLTITAPVSERIPLAEELDFISRYLEIEQVRFGDRLAVRIDAGGETLAALVPSMILQPVVENAIRHGISARERGGTVVITATRTGDRLRLVVEDDGPGLTAAAERIGLSNTRERLERLHPGRHRLELRSSERGGRVEIELPFATGPG